MTTQVEVLADHSRNIVEQFNTAAIYITHDLAVVAQMAAQASWCCAMARLVEEAAYPASMLEANPTEDYTKSLWAVRSFQKQAASGRCRKGPRW